MLLPHFGNHNIVATMSVVAVCATRDPGGGGSDYRQLDLWRPPRSFVAMNLCGVHWFGYA